jgi:hypothetical protein
MKKIVGLYVAWLVAAVMLVAAVIGPPAINFGVNGRKAAMPLPGFT